MTKCFHLKLHEQFFWGARANVTKLGPHVFHEVFDTLFAKVFVAFVETILVALEPIVTIGHPHTHTPTHPHTHTPKHPHMKSIHIIATFVHSD